MGLIQPLKTHFAGLARPKGLRGSGVRGQGMGGHAFHPYGAIIEIIQHQKCNKALMGRPARSGYWLVPGFPDTAVSR